MDDRCKLPQHLNCKERKKNARTAEKIQESYTALHNHCFILYIVAFQGGEDKVLLEAVSQESDFEVNLSEGVNYKLWIDNPEGPEKVNVTISKDSYVALQNIFVLTQPKKSYLPENPEFTVKESGIYHVHAKPLSPGTVYMEIEKLEISKLQ